MFGEKFIIGKSDGKIDNKNRISIPSFTYVEVNDGLIIQIIDDNDELSLKIEIFNKYASILEKLKKLRDNASSLAEFQRYDKEIEVICQKLDYLVTVDKQKRILIPISVMKALNWNSSDYIQCTGLGESLLVRKK